MITLVVFPNTFCHDSSNKLSGSKCPNEYQDLVLVCKMYLRLKLLCAINSNSSWKKNAVNFFFTLMIYIAENVKNFAAVLHSSQIYDHIQLLYLIRRIF